jgi:hypothetical protein
MRGHHETEAVKKKYPNVVPAPYLQSAFPEVYFDRRGSLKRGALALSRFRRYISPAFSRQSVRLRVSAPGWIRIRSGKVPGIQ